MSQSEHEARPPHEAHDNLADLDGIGEKYAAALAQAGITSFRDLTQYTPRTLSDLLKERTGVRISEKRIDNQNWIGQARQALGRQKLPAVSQPPVPTATTDIDDRWHEYGMFQITFEYRKHNGEEDWHTRVYDDRSGDEAVLPGVQSADWLKWVQDRVGFRVQSQQTAPPPPDTSAPSRAKIETLQAEQEKLHKLLNTAHEAARQAQSQAARIAELEQELESARAEAAEARARAESSTEALKSVTQQSRAQVEAAFQAVAAANRPAPGTSPAAPAPQSPVSQPTPTQAENRQQPQTAQSGLQVHIQNLSIEDNGTAQTRSGHVSFEIAGRQAKWIAHYGASYVVEIYGVDTKGNAITLLAKQKGKLTDDTLQYDVPLMLRIPAAGQYNLHARLQLHTFRGSLTATRYGPGLVQTEIKPPASPAAPPSTPLRG